METKEEIRERALKSRAEIEKADRRAAERVILERLVPVSYTHLDVYKRQIRDS